MKTQSPAARPRAAASLAIAAIVAAAALINPTAEAQQWPSKNVQIIVPAPPGGGPDLLARALAERLSARTGKAVVVENRPGANAIIGIQTTANSTPDGHTLLLVDRLILAVNPLLYAKLPYDTRQLTGITEVARVNLLWVARTDAPYKTWGEMVTRMQERREPITVGTSAPGSAPHLSLELIRQHLGGASLTAVPYRGVSQAVVGLLAGDVQGMITGPVPVLEHIRAGKLRGLAVGADTRMPLLPDVPTLRELGLPDDLLIPTYFTLHAPAATPAATVEAIRAAVAPILGDPDFAGQFAGRGLAVKASSPAEVEAGIAADGARVAKVIRDAGIKLE
ncbi:MAG: tripartite tricarboxylate transporter substrate binding protein [Burkholderiales bacterium]|nr:tripartite tricarboxylate transporter substrate binding protein [Burkholderiales bacterium]OJX04369.1 MAG: hypothetical protein BGO72_17430 [Burkholderiales bacterium 70-64]